MPAVRNKSQVQLALQALAFNKKLSLQQAAKLYSIPLKTLHRRRAGIPSRTEVIANSRNLDPFEKQVIIRKILNLYEQGFSPRLGIVEDIANLFLEMRSALRVGKY